MKSNQFIDKAAQKIYYTIVCIILPLMLCSFDECGGEPSPPPPTIQILSESSNNQTKFYFKPNEKVVIEKIEVKSAGQLLYNIIFGYPFLVCNANEKHVINTYSNVLNGYEFFFSGVSKTTGYRFNSLPGSVYY